MTRKLMLTILIITVLIMGAGCDNETESKTSTGGKIHAFIGGDEGLNVMFMEGAPPDEVYDNNYPFSLNVRLENVGEADIDPGQAKIRITGINPSDFGSPVLVKSVASDLRGAKLDPQGNEIAGGIENLEFTGFQAAPLVGTVEFNIKADVCYPYKTTTIAQICMLEDLLGKTRKANEKPFCEVNADIEFENSGAPVQITDFTETATGQDKVSFTFKIKHVGDGSIYKLGSDCSPEISNKDKVRVKVDTGLPGAVTCSGIGGNEGEINLFGNNQQELAVVCNQPLSTDRVDSEKQIKVELTYLYKDSVITPLKVRDI